MKKNFKFINNYKESKREKSQKKEIDIMLDTAKENAKKSEEEIIDGLVLASLLTDKQYAEFTVTVLYPENDKSMGLNYRYFARKYNKSKADNKLVYIDTKVSDGLWDRYKLVDFKELASFIIGDGFELSYDPIKETLCVTASKQDLNTLLQSKILKRSYNQ